MPFSAASRSATWASETPACPGRCHPYNSAVDFRINSGNTEPHETRIQRGNRDEGNNMPRNVLGQELQVCCESALTGFFRDGTCRTGSDDVGLHVICAQVTREFLEFSRARGNDLVSPQPALGFPGLKPGDRWCLCATRWKEALEAGVAPPVILAATHISALEYVDLEELEAHALDG